ncbi:hypothetical protein [Saccharospirillum alexandrii]|uniref:hypothetical protein n=1 Tax=Saccharospirillum alexandrii TaxID=2448477 RepID=UPI00373539EF
MRATAFVLMLAMPPWAWSETRPEPVSVISTAFADTQSAACRLAFEQAEDDARAQLGTGDTDRLELVSRTDERLGTTEDERFECQVETFWLERQALTAEQPQPDSIREDPLRLGGLESIEGRYQADCRASRRGEACREQIETEAGEALLNRLLQREGLSDDELALESDGFEGSQTFDYDQSDLTLTMDGTFYFIRVAPEQQATDSTPAPEPAGTQGELTRAKPAEPGPMDNLDVTLFYVWDGNDSASEDDLALSARRWGVGLWVDNRIGVSAFWGDERAGIADSRGNVHNAGDRYDIRGVGIGYRVFDNRSVTLENMIHYVDAQPYSTANLDPGCAACTPRSYEAEDYFQASVNLKTNNEGLNLGWMLTWKLRDDVTQFDSLSGGWYVELQF